MTIATSMDVFFDQLKDLKSATEQTVETLPHLINLASDERLREVLVSYTAETRRHLQEILAVFDGHGEEPGDDLCKAIAGLIEGGNVHLEMAADASVRDYLLIAHGNRIGHYLRGAAEFTLGIARKCELSAETDAVAAILTRHNDFTQSLARVAAGEFEIEMEGIE